MSYGFSFNGKHSINDYGLIMEYKYIQPPQKKKIKVEVPFMNYFYDFSTVGSNGEQVFTQRQIDVKVSLLAKNKTKEGLQILYSQVMEWLFDAPKSQLIFDDMPDFYYLAEVEQISSWDELQYWGNLQFSFIAEPFKYGTNFVGCEFFDTFNFETDYLQNNDFEINGSETITIYNPGRIISPIINVSNVMTIALNGYTSNLSIGDNKDSLFKLQPGINNISVVGTGHISFNFRKELL